MPLLLHEDPEDHRFIRMKIQVAETQDEVDENGDERKHGEEDNEQRNGNSNVITCHFWQSLW